MMGKNEETEKVDDAPHRNSNEDGDGDECKSDRKAVGVAYALPPEKQALMIVPSLVEHAKERGIHLFAVDPSKPVACQLPLEFEFECIIIIHKLYEAEWNEQLFGLKCSHPHVMVIDCPHSIQRLRHRISMLDSVNHLPSPTPMGIRIGIPKQLLFYPNTNHLDSLEFPVIAKPLESDGSPNSHLMSLVFTPDGLNHFNPQPQSPLVLQEFVNHGGVLFKVYVAGNHVRCVKRPSLPDLKSQSQSPPFLPFSRISNLPSPPGALEAELPPFDFVHHIAQGLRHALNLNLFNFDMIRDTRPASTYLIIDINYFPGYAKVPGFESMLTDFFLDLASSSSNPSPTLAFIPSLT